MKTSIVEKKSYDYFLLWEKLCTRMKPISVFRGLKIPWQKAQIHYKYFIVFLLGIILSFQAQAQESKQADQVNVLVEEIKKDVIQWRRHIHQNPELSNREFETAKYIEKHLRSLGLKVQTGIAHTGVVGILETGKPGPVVALRADIDALPIKEKVNLPFASKVTAMYNGKKVDVSHSCGHDSHAAMLMGAAHVLVKIKDQLRGTVKFIFQPAEEGTPDGEEGGAALMVKEGVLKGVDVIFGIHIDSQIDTGKIAYRPGGIMASADSFKIIIKGKGAHGAAPWASHDPIVTAAQLILGLQTIVSRELKLIDDAAVLSIGSVHGGNRSNIIPNEVELVGTLRTLDKKMREQAIEAIKRKVKGIADSMNVRADVILPDGINYPVTYNPHELMSQMLPTLNRTAGEKEVFVTKALLAAEDFAFYQEKIPGLYFFVGGKDRNMPIEKAPPHHSEEFIIDDSRLDVGVKLYTNLAIDYSKEYSKKK